MYINTQLLITKSKPSYMPWCAVLLKQGYSTNKNTINRIESAVSIGKNRMANNLWHLLVIYEHDSTRIIIGDKHMNRVSRRMSKMFISREKNIVKIMNRIILNGNFNIYTRQSIFIFIFTLFLLWQFYLYCLECSSYCVLQLHLLFQSARVTLEFNTTSIAEVCPTFAVYIITALFLLNPCRTFWAFLIIQLPHLAILFVKEARTHMKWFHTLGTVSSLAYVTFSFCFLCIYQSFTIEDSTLFYMWVLD